MAKQTRSKSDGKTSDATTEANAEVQDAVALLTADHRKVEQLFEQYQAAGGQGQKGSLAFQIGVELTVHTILEEEIFYPACREKDVGHDAMDRAQVEHDNAKILIQDLMAHSPEEPFYDAKMIVLGELIKQHVEEEERAGQGIFAKAAAAGVDMDSVGRQLSERRRQLLPLAQSHNLQPPRIRSLDLYGERRYTEENAMNRRDERRV